ncbi:MAG: TIGR04372 family glycosyltransferase, partial [Helicobacteraceae bacterium]|nr:TIGR04372 family glycosyltransferase [Helicobacteraceae bacterium]
RVGSVVKKQCNYKNEHFIDYPYSEFKSDFMDVFLLSECEFSIDQNSGIMDICTAFRKIRLGVNFIPIEYAPYANKNDLYIPKKLKIEGEYISLSKYMTMTNSFMDGFLHKKTYDDLAISVESNTQEEILELVKEFFGDIKYENKDIENQKNYQTIHSKINQVSQVRTNFGAVYLRKNSWYIA